MEEKTGNSTFAFGADDSQVLQGKELKGNPSSSSSSGLFNSVFPHPSSRKESPHHDIFGPPRKQEYGGQPWKSNAQKEAADENEIPKSKSSSTKGNKGSAGVYQSEGSDPCFLSNSLYYGGQDNVNCLPGSHNSGSPHSYKKDEKDDSGSSDFASRGNWWQGSLYY